MLYLCCADLDYPCFRYKKIKVINFIMKEREDKLRLIASLRYQMERYKSVRDGFMCQQMNSQIRQLMATLK